MLRLPIYSIYFPSRIFPYISHNSCLLSTERKVHKGGTMLLDLMKMTTDKIEKLKSAGAEKSRKFKKKFKCISAL